MNVALQYRDRIDASVMMPQINWRQPRNQRRAQSSREPVAVVEPSLEIVSGSAGKSNGSRRTTKRGRGELQSKVGR
jgi:hypothetical protein